MKTRWVSCLTLFAQLALVRTGISGQSAALPLALPVEPIQAILDAFNSYKVVALGEGTHGNQEGHAFRLTLLRAPEFSDKVDDIVVEVGSAKYQDVMDRFVRGEDVPYSTLRKVWQDTTQNGFATDKPIYEEFYRAVRTLNLTLPKVRQLRILLGDPPVDWDRVRTVADFRQLDRDAHAFQIIQREVLAKGRRALVICGRAHFQRGTRGSIVNRLEAAGTKVFSIWTTTKGSLGFWQFDAHSWPVPSLALLRGTQLGQGEVPEFHPLPLENQVDAVLNVGSFTIVGLLPALCEDSDYMRMRLRRMAMTGEADRLTKYCSSLSK